MLKLYILYFLCCLSVSISAQSIHLQQIEWAWVQDNNYFDQVVEFNDRDWTVVMQDGWVGAIDTNLNWVGERHFMPDADYLGVLEHTDYFIVKRGFGSAHLYHKDGTYKGKYRYEISPINAYSFYTDQYFYNFENQQKIFGHHKFSLYHGYQVISEDEVLVSIYTIPKNATPSRDISSLRPSIDPNEPIIPPNYDSKIDLNHPPPFYKENPPYKQDRQVVIANLKTGILEYLDFSLMHSSRYGDGICYLTNRKGDVYRYNIADRQIQGEVNHVAKEADRAWYHFLEDTTSAAIVARCVAHTDWWLAAYQMTVDETNRYIDRPFVQRATPKQTRLKAVKNGDYYKYKRLDGQPIGGRDKECIGYGDSILMFRDSTQQIYYTDMNLVPIFDEDFDIGNAFYNGYAFAKKGKQQYILHKDGQYFKSNPEGKFSGFSMMYDKGFHPFRDGQGLVTEGFTYIEDSIRAIHKEQRYRIYEEKKKIYENQVAQGIDAVPPRLVPSPPPPLRSIYCINPYGEQVKCDSINNIILAYAKENKWIDDKFVLLEYSPETKLFLQNENVDTSLVDSLLDEYLKCSFFYTEERGYSEGLKAVKWFDKWGAVDSLGVFEVVPQFDTLGDFTNGLAFAKIGSKVGVIRKDGIQHHCAKQDSLLTFRWGVLDLDDSEYTGEWMLRLVVMSPAHINHHFCTIRDEDCGEMYYRDEGEFINPDGETIYWMRFDLIYDGYYGGVKIVDEHGKKSTMPCYQVYPQGDRHELQWSFHYMGERLPIPKIEVPKPKPFGEE